MDNTEKIKVLSLCAGYGGLEIGLAGALQAILRIVAVEVEAFALANLVAKVEEGKLAIEALWPDLRTFPAERFRECFDIITAGYPCQPFSVAGKRQGKDDPRHLWPHIERIIEAVKPVWFFGENVSGHLTLGFPTVYRSLRNMGYAVEAGLFTAAECGAPHRRERLFILAYGKSFGYRRGIGFSQSNKDRISQSEPAREQIERSNCRSGELADTTGQRIQGPKPERTAQAGRQINEQSFKWPARPGQPQYEWEEPRVVDNALQRRHKPKKEQIQARGNGFEQTDKGQTQSRLGRAASRTPCRVDRLWLLGNGVVPPQAEKAFRYLIKKFEANR